MVAAAAAAAVAWCSGDHTRLVMGGRGFKSRSGQIFFQTFIQLKI